MVCFVSTMQAFGLCDFNRESMRRELVQNFELHCLTVMLQGCGILEKIQAERKKYHVPAHLNLQSKTSVVCYLKSENRDLYL